MKSDWQSAVEHLQRTLAYMAYQKKKRKQITLKQYLNINKIKTK